MGEITTKAEFPAIRERLRREGKTVAQCHGVFDLVHPGHIKHFEEARKLADVLVVSITAAKYVRKGPDRPYFDDAARMDFLTAIKYIDYVLLSEGYTGEDVIETVRPDFWVKGIEYADRKNDVTQAQDREVALVRKYGGDIRFTEGVQFSSTYLINKALAPFSEELLQFMYRFKETYSYDDVRERIESLDSLSVLVVGDTIIDEYIYCAPPGQMSKSSGYSTRILKKERSLGGSLAIARHAYAFTKRVAVLSPIGTEPEVLAEIGAEMDGGIERQFIESDSFSTIVKTKYMVENEKRKELDKLFSVNNVTSPAAIPEESRARLHQRLLEEADKYDVVFCCDFGHGTIDGETIGILQKKARFLAVNCQTNATNYGLNLITKYQKASVFALDQKELKLAVQNEFLSEQESLTLLKRKISAEEGWLTRGSKGAYGISREDEITDCPAVSTRVRDTVGAGDAFLTLAALAAAAGAGNDMSTFLGNIAGALGANIVGNTQAIDRRNVLKFAATLMNV